MSYLELMFIFKLPLAGMRTGNASTVLYIYNIITLTWDKVLFLELLGAGMNYKIN